MRKALALFLGLLLWTSLGAALEREPWEVFAGRRAKLLEKLSDGVTVLFAYTAGEGESIRSAFRQENNFYYLTGSNQPGAILMLTPRMKERGSPVFAEVDQVPPEILFLPGRDQRQERWTGLKVGPYDAGVAAQTGFAVVRSRELFERELSKAVAGFGRIHTLMPPARGRDSGRERRLLETLGKIAPLAEIADARSTIAGLRVVKSPGEIELIQKATDATIAAHLAAWKRAKPGLFEYQVAATMQGILFERGCERPAYIPIVGAGFNGTILHYAENSHRMDAGQLLLMDVGGEYSLYATDVTRTIPVSGKFSARQRELYDIVLGAQNAALAAVKPGMTLARTGLNSLHQIAYQHINTRGKDQAGNPLGKYFIHGLSHQVGLEVHDPAPPDTVLQPGMVFTIEPGIYIPEERIGIRIEDMVLVTENGGKLLSGALPRQAEEIERAMR